MDEQQRPHELPKDIVDQLRHVVAFTGNEKAVDEDPLKMLSILLSGLGEHLNEGSIRYVIRKYCSAEGVSLYSRRLLQEKKVA